MAGIVQAYFVNMIYLSVRPLNKIELEKLTTKRLLAYKKQLMKTLDKSSLVYQEILKNLKDILATREHIEK